MTASTNATAGDRGDGLAVAVVGAGAVGVTVAYDLARRGAEVTVYDRESVAAGASGRAAGVCYDAFASRPDASIGAEALDRFRAFADDGAPFVPCPYVWLAHEGDDERVRLVREGVERMQELGVDARRLEADGLAERFPTLRTDDVAVAGLTRGAGYTDPGAYTGWLAARAAEAGVRFEERMPVEVGVDPPRVVVDPDAARNEREVDALVVTAGAHSKRLLADAGVPIAMKPYRVQAFVGALDGVDEWEPIVYDASADWYARPHPEGILAGDGTETVEADPDGYAREADPGFAAGLASRLRHRLPDHSLDVRRAWAGLCTATPDRDPLVGELREGVYVATGLQGQGFMRSPALGRRLADEVLGGDGIDAFDPVRFDGDEAFEIREGMAVESDAR